MAKDLSAARLAQPRRHVEAPAAAVWGVLSDGWLYANWVVGTSRVRFVDLEWPAVGSTLQHSFGVWPAVVSDESQVLESEPDRRLVIRAEGWPMGEARVELTLDARDDGSCDVVMVEDAVAGPGTVVPRGLRSKKRELAAIRPVMTIPKNSQPYTTWSNPPAISASVSQAT